VVTGGATMLGEFFTSSELKKKKTKGTNLPKTADLVIKEIYCERTEALPVLGGI
jgi:hypothetical protein